MLLAPSLREKGIKPEGAAGGWIVSFGVLAQMVRIEKNTVEPMKKIRSCWRVAHARECCCYMLNIMYIDVGGLEPRVISGLEDLKYNFFTV